MKALILQHPQEPDKELGTARLANLSLPGSRLRIGLSWPNLKAALGEDATPSRWMVLHLGSGMKKASAKLPELADAPAPSLYWVDHKGIPKGPIEPQGLDGIVLLDGTWSQAKTLWWRNPWLLKLKRGVLVPSSRSLYGSLRREPRRECLSTLESVALAFEALGEPAEVSLTLRNLFSRLLERYRQVSPTRSAPKTHRNRR